MRSHFYIDEERTVSVSFDGAITSVVIVDAEGICGRGHAKHHPEDDYSLKFGEKLARSRAEQRYARKVERHLIKNTR